MVLFHGAPAFTYLKKGAPRIECGDHMPVVLNIAKARIQRTSTFQVDGFRLVFITGTVLLATFRFMLFESKLYAVTEDYSLQMQSLRDTSFMSLEPSEAFKNLLDLKFHNRATLEKYDIAYNENNHMKNKSDLRHLLEVQSAMYVTLHRWNQLMKGLGIDRWTAHGGSAIGAKCFGGMNPWDDDIDLTVLDCALIDQLWENGETHTL